MTPFDDVASADLAGDLTRPDRLRFADLYQREALSDGERAELRWLLARMRCASRRVYEIDGEAIGWDEVRERHREIADLLDVMMPGETVRIGAVSVRRDR